MYKSIVILLLFFLFHCKSDFKDQRVQNGYLDLSEVNFLNEGLISLDGEWYFYWQNFINENSNDESDFIKVPLSWDKKENPSKYSKFGYSSYRLKLKKKVSQDIYLFVPRLYGSYKIFLNSKLVLESGRISQNSENFDIGIEKKILKLPNEEDINLVVQISNYTLNLSGILNSFKVGTKNQIDRFFESILFFDFFCFGALFIIAIYHFTLILQRENNRSILLFSLISILLAIRQLVTGNIFIDQIFLFPSIYILKIDLLTWYITGGLFIYYLSDIFPKEFDNKLILLFIALIYSLISIIVLVSNLRISFQTILFMQIITLIVLIYVLFNVMKAFTNRRLGSKTFLTGFFAFFITVLNDILFENGVIDSIYLSTLGLLIFMFSQSSYLFYKFSNMYKEKIEQSEILQRKKEDLSKAHFEIEKLSIAKDEFLSNLSHEIRTPLTVLFGYSELLIEKDIDHQIKFFIENIFTNSKKLNQYINEILLVIDIESNFEVNKTYFKIEELIDEVLMDFDFELKSKNIKILKQNLENLHMTGDRNLWKISFDAVISNSIRFNHDNGEIKIQRLSFGRKNFLQIIDHGIGIRSEILPQVTEKFFKFNALNDDYGVGLGLFLVKKISELHEISFNISSREGEYTNVLFSIN
jgi:signal transduction histidine kinase